jgi:hypothetical protein
MTADVFEMNIWLNKINNLNKKMCTISALDAGFYTGPNQLFDREGVLYGNKVVLTSTTLVVEKEYSGVTNTILDAKYIFTPVTKLEFSMYNIHPTRGIEVKHFNWVLGTVALK